MIFLHPNSEHIISCLKALATFSKYHREGNGTPLHYSCLENPMGGGAWKAAVHGVAEGQARLSDFTFTFHLHVLEKEMATHSSVLAWRIPGTGEPGGLPSMGLHRVRHDWSDLAAAVAAVQSVMVIAQSMIVVLIKKLRMQVSSVQLLSCVWLPVHHQLPEPAQTRVHRVGDASANPMQLWAYYTGMNLI